MEDRPRPLLENRQLKPSRSLFVRYSPVDAVAWCCQIFTLAAFTSGETERFNVADTEEDCASAPL